jgi:bacterial/archaeal transporter family protein
MTLSVTWLAYALATVVLWATWSFLGAVALRSISVAQATLLFGVATVTLALAALALSGRGAPWSPSGLATAAISGVCGAAGMITFYLALDNGKASAVVPVIGAYPALVAILAVAFLSERLTMIQAVGVGLVLLGVVLVSAGA